MFFLRLVYVYVYTCHQSIANFFKSMLIYMGVTWDQAMGGLSTCLRLSMPSQRQHLAQKREENFLESLW